MKKIWQFALILIMAVIAISALGCNESDDDSARYGSVIVRNVSDSTIINVSIKPVSGNSRVYNQRIEKTKLATISSMVPPGEFTITVTFQNNRKLSEDFELTSGETLLLDIWQDTIAEYDPDYDPDESADKEDCKCDE